MDKREISMLKAELDRAKRRLIAVDIARATTGLTDEKNFDDAVAALKANDKDAFLAVCTRAQILPSVAEQLWKCLRDFLDKVGGGWVGLP